ncbi:deoxyribonuclease IV [Deferribacter autotrophicus]|uniref:Probable endonuclease 4 n=2 Tax=Deferribacter autotrophicus TaxID=500465 RepID=A0A5A8F386_9BACT|nr:deoxyribonuclease IV [Deferribacter autotrophicus]
MFIGAHESIAGGVYKSINFAISDGDECLQIFVKNASRWKAKPLTVNDINRFIEKARIFGIDRICAHSSYLINLCSPRKDTEEKSIECFIDEMSRCEQLKIPYYVMHPGSHLGEGEEYGLKKLVNNIDKIYSEYNFDVMLLLETTAGQGTNLGYKWEHIHYVIEHSKFSEKIGICLDSAHLYAAGYDLKNNYDEVIDLFISKFGDKIKVFHLNDTNKNCGSRVDRHEYIGRGILGLEFFEKVVNDKRLGGVLGVLETPIDNDETYKVQVEILKSLRREL